MYRIKIQKELCLLQTQIFLKVGWTISNFFTINHRRGHWIRRKESQTLSVYLMALEQHVSSSVSSQIKVRYPLWPLLLGSVHQNRLSWDCHSYRIYYTCLVADILMVLFVYAHIVHSRWYANKASEFDRFGVALKRMPDGTWFWNTGLFFQSTEI